MRIIKHDDIVKLNISPYDCLKWVDEVLDYRDSYTMPPKTRIKLVDTDYCNIMPVMDPNEGVFGLKVVNRCSNRRRNDGLNLDSQILIYDGDTCNLKAILVGNYITSLRTAAIAVHSVFNYAEEFNTIAMLGLGNIGTLIGKLLFDLTREKHYTVKVLKYKNDAERFIERFKEYDNVEFVVCEDYCKLMSQSDVILSSVSYTKDDFCASNIYKNGCTIIPVHLRGFMNCDSDFEHIIVSDMERAKKEFKYFKEFRKVSVTDDIRESKEDRVIIYNLGLAITDLYFANRIMGMFSEDKEIDTVDIRPSRRFYV